MGQKVNPTGFRLGVTEEWRSNWYADKNYAANLQNDLEIREFLTKALAEKKASPDKKSGADKNGAEDKKGATEKGAEDKKGAGEKGAAPEKKTVKVKKGAKDSALAKIEIERAGEKVKVTIHTSRPGVIIGKKGQGVDELRKELEPVAKGILTLDVKEVKLPETNAVLVAQSIAEQIEGRVAFRRAMRKAVQSALKSDAKGIRIQCSGRLGGAEMSRREWYGEGRIPRHTIRADIEYGFATAATTMGSIGVQVWIYKGDVIPGQPKTKSVHAPANRPSRPRRERSEKGAK